MAPAVGQQALFFLWAMAFGAGLHVCYRFLGALRQRAPALTVMADGAFLLLAAWALTVYLLGVCRGQFQLYQLLGLGLRRGADPGIAGPGAEPAVRPVLAGSGQGVFASEKNLGIYENTLFKREKIG